MSPNAPHVDHLKLVLLSIKLLYNTADSYKLGLTSFTALGHIPQVSAREKQLATMKASNDELNQQVSSLKEELAAAVQAQAETRAAVDAQLQVSGCQGAMMHVYYVWMAQVMVEASAHVKCLSNVPVGMSCAQMVQYLDYVMTAFSDSPKHYEAPLCGDPGSRLLLQPFILH